VVALALDLAAALDPVLLAVQTGVEPDDWQARVLRSGADRLLLCCSRQSGKSLTTALLAVWTALYRPDSLILMLSPSQRQSGLLFKTCLSAYRTLGRPVPALEETATGLTLANGSRIASLPGREGTVRGFSGVRLLIIDEAAWVEDDLYASVRPMLAASGGRLVALSTPHGTRGWFYQAWRSESDWERYEVPAALCPRIAPEFLEEERRELGEWWYAQEYECKFIDAESQAFRSESVERAFRERVEAWTL
jgi:hypothetical protein